MTVSCSSLTGVAGASSETASLVTGVAGSTVVGTSGSALVVAAGTILVVSGGVGPSSA